MQLSITWHVTGGAEVGGISDNYSSFTLVISNHVWEAAQVVLLLNSQTSCASWKRRAELNHRDKFKQSPNGWADDNYKIKFLDVIILLPHFHKMPAQGLAHNWYGAPLRMHAIGLTHAYNEAIDWMIMEYIMCPQLGRMPTQPSRQLTTFLCHPNKA